MTEKQQQQVSVYTNTESLCRYTWNSYNVMSIISQFLKGQYHYPINNTLIKCCQLSQQCFVISLFGCVSLSWGNWNIFELYWSVWDLVPWPRIEPRPPTFGAWNLSHWTTREVPQCCFYGLQDYMLGSAVQSPQSFSMEQFMSPCIFLGPAWSQVTYFAETHLFGFIWGL